MLSLKYHDDIRIRDESLVRKLTTDKCGDWRGEHCGQASCGCGTLESSSPGPAQQQKPDVKRRSVLLMMEFFLFNYNNTV